MDPRFTERFVSFVLNAYDAEWSRDFNPYIESE